jgi:hypothetical protein
MRLPLAFIVAGVAVGQVPFPMKYLGEVGHLGQDLFDRRKFADFGFARAFPDEYGELRFEGPDHAGKIWRVWMPQVGGVGSTEVWTGDFDHNGQADLLIARSFPGNGRCVSNADLTMLLFDASGRPVPWTASTEIPDTERRFPYRPAVLVDANNDGRAEIVTTRCGPWDANSLDFQVTGVYEAREAHWLPMQDVPLEPYIQAAHAAHPSYRPGYIHWLPVQPEKWPDQMKLVDADSVDGNGAGWPAVVIDGPDGRGIYTDDADDVLRRLQEAGYHFRIFGENSKPAWPENKRRAWFWVDIH